MKNTQNCQEKLQTSVDGLPVEYSEIQEHEAACNAAGLLMYRIWEKSLLRVRMLKVCAENGHYDISTMKDFQIYYSPMCYEDGGVVDDQWFISITMKILTCNKRI